MQEKKEHIKTRMLKNAAKLWSYPETEAENNFDPLVSMLLDACSTELEKISGEIHASRARVMERLVQLLAPDTLTGALPAHALATALPVEPTTELKEDTQFYTRIKLASANENEAAVSEDIFFTPADTFRLNRASVRFMATGDQLFKINAIQKEVIAVCNGNTLPPSTLWLGIDEPDVSLDNTLFHFDLRNEADKKLFYHHLPNAKWFYNAYPLKHLPGYGNRKISGESFEVNSIRTADYSVCHTLKKQVNAFYKPYFIILLDPDRITVNKENNQIPAIIRNAFKSKEGELSQQSLRWISIQFPEAISNRLLQDLVCTPNCFPVINRQLHEVHYRLQELINVIPLHSSGIFLDLEDARNEEDKPLAIHSFQNDSKDSFTMLMRNGGIGRFDERDAVSLIEYLIGLLRDESAAFYILNNDIVNSEIKQLQQVINRLEQRLSSQHMHREARPYLVIYNTQKLTFRTLFIKYSSTNGKQANHIKAGTLLQTYDGSSINSVLLVSNTKGGRDKLNATESVLAYKSALLSKDRLVTVEDIKAFCYYQLGERLENITIQKGVLIHSSERQGYLKTLDVILSLSKTAYDAISEKNELLFWEENIRRLLEEKSSTLMHYRVIIKKAP